MERIRIVLSELPRMLREIVHEAIDRQSDMLVVSDRPAGDQTPSVNGQLDMDVVIAGLTDDTLPDRYSAFMCAHPSVKVLGLSGDARRAFLFELRPHPIPLGAASPDGLLDAIRATVRTTDA